MSDKVVRIGLVGFGTVGCGVAKILLEDAGVIKAKTGLTLELATVVDIDTETERAVKLPAGMLTNDINALLGDPTIDIAIELVGGTTIAKDFQIKMLKAGKNVVTANKALLAKHGRELKKVALENNKTIAFEASCAGGIPIVSALRTGLAANRITAMYGIMNGTCNYILSSMATDGDDFPDALAAAQKLGYAEADPTLDINGGDSAHKLAILASIALGCQIELEDISIEGIEDISIGDIRYGEEMGYVLKLLAIVQKESNGKFSLRVHPSFIAKANPLANVNGPFNAISVFGHAVGQTVYYGRGAGMMATASAIVADIIDVAYGNSANLFNNMEIRPKEESEAKIEKIENLNSRFYIRLMAKDDVGVFAHVGNVLAENDVSISGVLQHEGHNDDNTVPVVITTHEAQQSDINATLEGLEKLECVCGRPVCIRIVDIPEDKD